jgi:hypothetical protein
MGDNMIDLSSNSLDTILKQYFTQINIQKIPYGSMYEERLESMLMHTKDKLVVLSSKRRQKKTIKKWLMHNIEIFSCIFVQIGFAAWIPGCDQSTRNELPQLEKLIQEVAPKYLQMYNTILMLR